ncbi:MAG: TIGR01212 family radical SAM protein, partial [Erysipelotrichaceae bacterium]
MNNPFKYSLDNKRYHTFNYDLKTRFQSKVAKVSLDAFFTCPNRDGTLSHSGCIFCSARGSGDYTFQDQDLLTQYHKNLEVMRRKWPNCLTIPYFQAFTNTYGPLSKIQSMLAPFIQREEVCAIAIATRPDCLEQEKIDYLASLTSQKEIWIELGLQSSNDETAKWINRGHDFQCLKDCLEKLSKTPIKVCIHIINGLPCEQIEDMLQTIKDIQDLPFHGLKIHMLHIIKNTPLANMFADEKIIDPLTKEEYIDLVIRQLELLPKHIVIQRITGDPV